MYELSVTYFDILFQVILTLPLKPLCILFLCWSLVSSLESSHSCFLLCCWEICSWADCWLWAKAFFPFNKLSRLSSIRTTFYYYCVYDCSTWLPKALLTLSVKPGLELWALAAIPAALLLLRLEPDCCVLLSVHGRQGPRSAAQQVWQCCRPGSPGNLPSRKGVMRRVPFVSGVLPVEKGSVHALHWARRELTLPGLPSLSWQMQGLGSGVLPSAFAGTVHTSGCL